MSDLSFGLTHREREVYDLTVTGKCNKEIAAQLGITTRTVRFHLSNIFAKTCVTNRLELICAMANLSAKIPGSISA